MTRLYRWLLIPAACSLGAAAACQTTYAAEPGGPAAESPLGLALKAVGQEYRFDTGELRGTLRLEGKSLGLRPVLAGAPGTPIAGMMGLFSPYRMLAADARFGTAAWDWASRAKSLPDGAVEVQWTADQEHPFDLAAVYRFSGPGTLDLNVTVEPRHDLRRFELFLASYFQGFPACFAYVGQGPAAGGQPAFMAAVKPAGDWQMFPRDAEAVQMARDGRWKRPPNPVQWQIMPRLAAPLALRRDAPSGLTAVLMAPADDCFAVSMPYGEEGHRSVYLSLFGRDLKAGQPASARARLVIGPAISDPDAVRLYEQWTGSSP
jgi:hypothetical protein